MNRVYGPEPRPSGGNTSSNPQVLALDPRSAPNVMERMCQHNGHIHRYGAPIFDNIVVYVSEPINNNNFGGYTI